MARIDKITPDNIHQKIDDETAKHRGLNSRVWKIAVTAGLKPAALAKLFNWNIKTATKYYQIELDKRKQKKAEHNEAVEMLDKF